MKILKLAIIAAVTMALSSCAIYHHYAPYYGQVIDGETEKPLEGAVVLVYYSGKTYFSPGGPIGFFVDAQEALTDSKGEFKISSLNAFAFRPLSTFNSEPGFRIFKPGYRCSYATLIEDQYDRVRLRKLNTKEERRRFNLSSCTPDLPNEKMMKFRKLQDVEAVDLGLDPIFPVREQK